MPSLQSRIDAIPYPPTHTYRLDGLVPTGVLAERVAIIDRLVPHLFDGGSFLDVGCNKGYFSLRASLSCSEVVSVDTDPEFVSLCKDLAPENMSVSSEFPVEGSFDRVFIGNTHHYLYVKHMTWAWIFDLARRASNTLVIEGPVGMECLDMHDCIPENLRADFTKQAILDACDKWFDLVDMVPTATYTPDRYVMHFTRKDDLINTDMKRYAEYIEHVYKKMSPYTLDNDVLTEVCCRHDRGVISQRILRHSKFIAVDKNQKLPGWCKGHHGKIWHRDVTLNETPECDVLISTAILHHLDRKDWKTALRNMSVNTRRTIMLSGPSDRCPMIGDHKSSIDPEVVADSLPGWSMELCERIGLNEPLSEWLMVFTRDS